VRANITEMCFLGGGSSERRLVCDLVGDKEGFARRVGLPRVVRRRWGVRVKRAGGDLGM
jgi:hypothetical protein